MKEGLQFPVQRFGTDLISNLGEIIRGQGSIVNDHGQGKLGKESLGIARGLIAHGTPHFKAMVMLGQLGRYRPRGHEKGQQRDEETASTHAHEKSMMGTRENLTRFEDIVHDEGTSAHGQDGREFGCQGQGHFLRRIFFILIVILIARHLVCDEAVL